jgi:ribosomal protein S18 acetylase RimI-like enzyme
MEESIRVFNKYIIMCDNMPVGCVSSKQMETAVYEVGNLCIIPEYQGKGIGTAAMEFIKTHYQDWKTITLVTPADKTENVRFYT